MAPAQNLNFISHLSPLRDLLTSIEGACCIVLTGIKTGTTLGIIDFGSDFRVTCLCWVTNTRLIVGNNFGEVMQADLTCLIPNSSKLAELSLIAWNYGRPVKALCFDISTYLLAASFDGQIKVWHGYLLRGSQREWVLYDTVLCQRDGAGWSASTMAFFSTNNKSLFVATDFRFAIWAYSDKSLSYHERANPHAIEHCAVSFNNRTLAISTRNLCVLIWLLSASGPISKQQRTFKIPLPASRDWIGKVNSLPVSFLDAKSIVTADPAGTVYVVSLDGQVQRTCSLGDNYFVKSIWIHEPTAQIIALGLRGNPLIIGCTYSREEQHTDMGLERSLAPCPGARIQDVSVELSIIRCWKIGTIEAVLEAHLRCFDLVLIVVATAELWYRGKLECDFTAIWSVLQRAVEIIWMQMFVDGVWDLICFIGRVLSSLIDGAIPFIVTI